MQIKVLIEMNTEHQSFPIKNGLYLIVAITSFYNNYKAKTPGQSFARLVACETEISSAYLNIGPFSSIVALTIINAFERLQARKGKKRYWRTSDKKQIYLHWQTTKLQTK